MIAAIERETPDRLCVVRWTGRVRLHVEVLTVCGEKMDAADGVVQVPDDVVTGRAVKSVTDFNGKGQRLLTICPGCKNVIARSM